MSLHSNYTHKFKSTTMELMIIIIIIIITMLMIRLEMADHRKF